MIELNKDLVDYFKKLKTKEKNVFLKFTYWNTIEPKAQQRLRGFAIFCKAHKIQNVYQLEGHMALAKLL
jgi:hypothetical protein